ncbi:S-adenosyl-L-methionine-dependent methyltransferase [Tirmania nivea]|nr:S-adenosyl-L-methionine-dependent methyltransferase [Tirmania nivea]
MQDRGKGSPELTYQQSEYFESSSDSREFSGSSPETFSVGSSVFSFTYSNGRRYHSDRFKEADYFMPNDENEQERLDMYHHIFLLLLHGNLYTAPLEKIEINRVLDAGTGTGIWAIDFADQYPLAQVIGTDISPIQPTCVPANCRFEVDDMEEKWVFPKNYFDYIHMRSLSGSIRDWPELLKQCYNSLTPGGYFEFQDYSCELFMSNGERVEGIHPEYPFATYLYHVCGAADRIGRSLTVGSKIKGMLQEVGFEECVEKAEIWPMSDWPKDQHLKELGRWGRLGANESAYTFALQLLTREGWTVDQVRDLSDALLASLRKGGPKHYVTVWFVYGRKPLRE